MAFQTWTVQSHRNIAADAASVHTAAAAVVDAEEVVDSMPYLASIVSSHTGPCTAMMHRMDPGGAAAVRAICAVHCLGTCTALSAVIVAAGGGGGVVAAVAAADGGASCGDDKAAAYSDGLSTAAAAADGIAEPWCTGVSHQAQRNHQ